MQDVKAKGSVSNSNKKKGDDDPKDDDNELNVVLATIDASLQEQGAYEGDVLRRATHALAPVLSPAETLGFPESTIALLVPPNINASAAVSKKKNAAAADSKPSALLLHSVLQSTRRQIEQLNDSNGDESIASAKNLLYMKEQILLHAIYAISGDTDSCVPTVAEERATEQARSRRLRQGSGSEGNATEASGRRHSNVVRFADPSMDETQKQKPRVRVPMMKRKRISNENDDLDDESASVIKTTRLTEQQKADLHERRLQRRQQKEQRRLGRRTGSRSGAQRQEGNTSAATATKAAVVETTTHSSDEEAEMLMDTTATEVNTTDDMAIAVGATATAAANTALFAALVTREASPIPDPTITASATCPDCGAILTVDSNGNGDHDMDADAVLALHLSTCSGRPQRRRTPLRQSSRTAQRPVVSYANKDDDDEHDEMIDSEAESDDDDEVPARKKSTRSTKRTNSTTSQTQASSSSPALTRETARTAVLEEEPLKRPALTAADSANMDDIDEWAYEDRVDDWIEHGLNRMKAMRERDDTEALPGALEYNGGLLVPAWMNDRLFEYQREGIKWMWDLHREKAGGIVGDEMGLGKTVQVASYLGAAASSRKLESVLIIAPATILQHWLRELSVWAPGLRRVLVHTSGGDVDGSTRTISAGLLQKLSKWLRRARADRINEAIDDEDWNTLEPHSFCGTGYAILTTYENLRRNVDVYAAHNWSYLVLDEAQKIRNPDADITLACKRIRTFHRLAMSGTPIQNDLRELWSLFDFVFPGRLGTLPTFEQEFAVPIKRGGYSNASPMQVQLAYRCAITLRDLIQPFLLRRLKKDVKEVSRMPGKTEHVLFCRLSQRQRAMYEAYLLSDDVRSVIRGGTQLLAAVTMLRKIANHPDLVVDPSESSLDNFVRSRGSMQAAHAADEESDEDDSDDDVTHEASLLERSGKLEVLAKILPLWKRQGHRVLIFCQWRKMLNIIERFVRLNNWKFGRLDGNTNVASRQRLVDSFNTDESYFGMLCTTRTGGVGLNLIGANRCIIYDPDWNPSGDAQARERAWRFGQEKEVTIYRLITSGTIEEQIYKRQVFKTALSNKVLQDPRQRRLFSQNDLRDLFSLAPDTGSLRSGGDGITETSKVTKGVGVVDVVTDVSSENEDNEATLKNIMKSKGLAGIFDHHSVEPDNKRQTTTAREMEVHAKRIAKEAAKALEQSVQMNDPFAPTWTGSNETNPGRFGSSRPIVRESGHSSLPAAPALFAGPMSSANLLSKLRERNSAIESGGKSNPADEETMKYSSLLGRLKNFIRRLHPSTEEILAEFDNVPDSDVAIFRQLLKSVASIDNGRWVLAESD